MSRVQYLFEMDSDLKDDLQRAVQDLKEAKDVLQLTVQDLKEAGAPGTSVRSVIHSVLYENLNDWKERELKRLAELGSHPETSEPGMKAFTVTLSETRKGIVNWIPLSIVGGVPAFRLEKGGFFGTLIGDEDEKGTFGVISVDPRIAREAMSGPVPRVDRVSLALAKDGLWMRPPRAEDAARAIVFVEQFRIAARTRPLGEGAKLILGSEEGRGNFLAALDPGAEIVIDRPAHHDPKPMIVVRWDGSALTWDQYEYADDPNGDRGLSYI
jgi:hypothetical protein